MKEADYEAMQSKPDPKTASAAISSQTTPAARKAEDKIATAVVTATTPQTQPIAQSTPADALPASTPAGKTAEAVPVPTPNPNQPQVLTDTAQADVPAAKKPFWKLW